MSFNNTLLISKRLTTISSHARAHPSTPKSNNQKTKTDKNICQANARATRPKSARREPTTSIQQTQPISRIRATQTYPAKHNRSSSTAQTNNVDGRQSHSSGAVANLQIEAS